MLILAKFFANLLSILNSEVSPRQISAGFALGVLVGLLPVRGLFPYVLTVISLVINVNLAMMAVSAALFKIISFALDPLANKIGFYLLTQIPFLKSFWTKLANMPVIPFTRFNNTIVLGSLVLGILLLIPMYFLAKIGIVKYRTHLRDKILKLKIVQFLKASSVWSLYESIRGIRK